MSSGEKSSGERLSDVRLKNVSESLALGRPASDQVSFEMRERCRLRREVEHRLSRLERKVKDRGAPIHQI